MTARTAEQIVAALLEGSEFSLPEALEIGEPEIAQAVAFIKEVQDEARAAERARLALSFADEVRIDYAGAVATHCTENPVFLVQERRDRRSKWAFVQPFFTQKAAERYIASNRHNLGKEARVYVGSGYRNYEWAEVRAACLESTK